MRDRYTNTVEPDRRNDIYYELLGIMSRQWLSVKRGQRRTRRGLFSGLDIRRVVPRRYQGQTMLSTRGKVVGERRRERQKRMGREGKGGYKDGKEGAGEPRCCTERLVSSGSQHLCLHAPPSTSTRQHTRAYVRVHAHHLRSGSRGIIS